MRPSFLGKVSNMNIDEKAEERRTLIKKWLVELGFVVNEYQDENAAFGFGAETGGDKIAVYQPIDQPDLVVIAARLSLNAYSKLLSNRRNTVQGSLLWELGFALLDTGLIFEREGDPIKWINLHANIYSDGLTKDRFAQKILKVQLAMRRIFWMLDRDMKKPVPTWKVTYIG